MAYVYILKLSNGSYYIGSCRDIEKRLRDHSNKQVKSTKYKLPFSVMYIKKFLAYHDVRKEELRIKSWKKRKSIENLCQFDKENMIKNGPIV